MTSMKVTGWAPRPTCSHGLVEDGDRERVALCLASGGDTNPEGLGVKGGQATEFRLILESHCGKLDFETSFLSSRVRGALDQD